jgi:hypothetical protein
MTIVAKITNDELLVQMNTEEIAQLRGFRSSYEAKDSTGKHPEVGQEIHINEIYKIVQQIRENFVLGQINDIKKEAEKIIRFADKIGEMR